MSQEQLTQRQVLEAGLTIFRRVFDTNQIPLNRTEARDIINFEIVVQQLIEGMRNLEGKTRDEVIELTRQAFESSKLDHVPASESLPG